MMTGTWSTITRWAAIAIACNPEEQNRFTVTPLTETGKPALRAICLAILSPVAPSGLAQPIMTSSTSAGSILALLRACATTCPPKVAPWVILKLPRHDFVSAVLAVDTMTASVIILPCISKIQLRTCNRSCL